MCDREQVQKYDTPLYHAHVYHVYEKEIFDASENGAYSLRPEENDRHL